MATLVPSVKVGSACIESMLIVYDEALQSSSAWAKPPK